MRLLYIYLQALMKVSDGNMDKHMVVVLCSSDRAS
jgi:hypothetical protein